MRLLVVLLALVLGAPTVMAQPRGRGAPAPVDRRERIKKKIRALRAYTLTEELKLDEVTAGRLFPVLAKWDDVTDKLLVARADLTRQLEGAGALKDPRAIDKLIDDAVANQKAFWDLEDKRLAELRKILTPAQAARIVVVLPQFERRIQNQLRRVIQNQRAGGRDDDDGGETIDPFRDRDRRAPGSRGPAPATVPAPRGQPICDPFSARGKC